MREGWTTTTLKTVTKKIGSGSTPRGGKNVYVADGAAFVRSQNVHDYRFDATEIARLSVEAAHQLRGVAIAPNDVLICITGESVTRTAIIDESILPAHVSQHVSIVRADPDLLDPHFLQYSLLNPQTKEFLNSISEAGATRRALTKGDLERVEIMLPPVREQISIANVLRAFDDLINTNKRLVEETLALSRCWYAALSTEASETQTLGDVATVSEKSIRAGKSGSLTYLDISSLEDGGYELDDEIEWSTAPSRARRTAEVGDTLWATVRPNRRGHAMLTNRPDNLVVSTGIAVLHPTDIGPAELSAATDSEDFITYLVGRAEGSAYPAVRSEDFRQGVIAKLPHDVSANFESKMAPLWEMVGKLREESLELTQARDVLLPLLVSGKITPISAAKLLEGATN